MKVLALMMVFGLLVMGTVFANGSSESSKDTTTVTWLASRPVGGAIDVTIREIAQEYSEMHDGEWVLEIETTADRPSYLQKLKTLVAGNNIPDIIDIDADPYCQQLVDAGLLVNVKSFLKDEGVYDNFQETALRYQEFVDGSMYTLPLEYHIEMIWYNKNIFNTYGLKPPKTMDEWLSMCETLEGNGITPISVDGVDRWPVLRYLSMLPFRRSANEYIIDLRDGNASMGDPIGREAIAFMQNIGQYFQEGFAATDYATAKSIFLDGRSAMYYIGDWEQSAMLDKYNKGEVDYFLLPMVKDSVTDANEYCANSGIGMAFNVDTFDEKTKDFILYVIENYGAKYAAKMQMSPLKNELPADVEFTDLYKKINADMNDFGYYFMKPWDTYLDSATNTILQDNLLLLASGDMDAETFISLVDNSIAQNTK
jgi:raffinose/stachyose/melibiose transport system substrate-binding protein